MKKGPSELTWFDLNLHRELMMELRWPLSKNVLQKLSRKKYRKELNLYLIEGISTVSDAVSIDAPILGIVFDSRLVEKEKNLLALFEEKNIPTEELTEGELAKISGLVTPPPVIAVVKKDTAVYPTLPLKDKLVLALDGVADPGNLGTLIRSAVFFGIREIWLGEGCVEAYNPKVLRSAMTAQFGVTLCENVPLLKTCEMAREEGTLVMVATMDGISSDYPELSENNRGILILGNEPNGVNSQLVNIADYKLTISREGPVESLNVAMAGTVMIDRLLQRKKM